MSPSDLKRDLDEVFVRHGVRVEVTLCSEQSSYLVSGGNRDLLIHTSDLVWPSNPAGHP